MPRLLFKESERTGSSAKLGDRDRKIRCPRCKWQPRKTDRWSCACGHVWNTFDTRGMCPACDAVWANTQCLSCHQWSAHADWYGDDDAS